MLPARSLALAATVLLLVGGCRGGASGPKVTLRYHPPAGAAYHYTLDQQNAMRIEGGPMSAMPEQAARGRGHEAMRLARPPLGRGPVPGASSEVESNVTGMGP